MTLSDGPVPNGVLLMTYGSPRSVQTDDIRDYMTRVRGGREPEAALVTEFVRRYQVIGGSPLIEISVRQSAALEAELGFPAAAGMRFSEPSIQTAMAGLARRGARRIAAIILSPQYSPLLMGGYRRAIDEARGALGSDAPAVSLARQWHLEPGLVEGLGRRIREALARLEGAGDRDVPVLLTAHSLPLRVAQQEPGYLEQLSETATAVAAAAKLGPDQWWFCWQSAGHEPGAWMKPDFADLMPELAGAGHRVVLVAPVQFLADHLEILYDVDVGARDQAAEAGLRFVRIESLNAAPELIRALATIARRTLAEAPAPEVGEISPAAT